MKLKFISMAVFSALTLGVATNASAATTVNGGAVHFKGDVVNAACAVDAGSVNQIVQMGQVRAAKLQAKGNTSNAVPFSITLSDCDTSTTHNVGIVFTGASTPGDATVLSLQGSAAGLATNVGIQVLDHKGKPVSFDGALSSSEYAVSSDSASIPFQALYIATGPATAGTANADATFKVQYQ